MIVILKRAITSIGRKRRIPVRVRQSRNRKVVICRHKRPGPCQAGHGSQSGHIRLYDRASTAVAIFRQGVGAGKHWLAAVKEDYRKNVRSALISRRPYERIAAIRCREVAKRGKPGCLAVTAGIVDRGSLLKQTQAVVAPTLRGCGSCVSRRGVAGRRFESINAWRGVHPSGRQTINTTLPAGCRRIRTVAHSAVVGLVDRAIASGNCVVAARGVRVAEYDWT